MRKLITLMTVLLISIANAVKENTPTSTKYCNNLKLYNEFSSPLEWTTDIAIGGFDKPTMQRNFKYTATPINSNVLTSTEWKKGRDYKDFTELAQSSFFRLQDYVSKLNQVSASEIKYDPKIKMYYMNVYYLTQRGIKYHLYIKVSDSVAVNCQLLVMYKTVNHP